MLTRRHPKVRRGQETKSARHLIDLIGSPRKSAPIYLERWTEVPAARERFTRLAPGLDGRLATLRAQAEEQVAAAKRELEDAERRRERAESASMACAAANKY